MCETSWKIKLEAIQTKVARRTEERSELSRDARQVGENLAHLPD